MTKMYARRKGITSDYAIQHEAAKTTTFKKNVVVTMADGSIIKTDEIIYDEANESFTITSR